MPTISLLNRSKRYENATMLNASQEVVWHCNRSYLMVFLLLFNACFILAQTTSKASAIVQNSIRETEKAQAACVAPSLMTYAVNNAFYCTGIPISPNILSFSGSAFIDLTISPDLPNGLNFDMNTGTISGTPTEDVSGNYTIILINPCGSTLKVIYIAVSSGTNYYSDTDGDGFGTGTATVSCSGQPAGTSIYNTDCAPNDATKWRTSNLFVDQDLDGYNNGFPATLVCYGSSVPLGYTSVNIGTDCIDTNKNINSNVVEVFGNGIDDNCDGTIDEVTTTSNLIATSCGVTITNLSTTLFAQPISGAQGYRFEVTNGTTVSVFETTLSRFNLLNITPGVLFSTTSTQNSVRVSVKIGGFWRPYGSSCIVNTPPVPNSTSISNPRCGSFLNDIWDSMFCYNIPSATAYRFRVRLGSTIIGTYDSPVNRFSFANIGVNNLVFATGYTIDILLQINGVWRPDTEYGNTCLIITPPTPGVSRVTSPSCGSSTNNLWTTIFAIPITGAQGYKFVINNGIQFREIITPTTSFSIHSIPGGPVRGTTYTIRVDVLYNNSYVEGRELCTLTVLPTAVRQTNTALDVYEVKAYPNPYTAAFKLDMNTSGEDPVGVKVYDMIGREVESRQASVADIIDMEIGAQYPSGVYNVIVTQGDHVKSLRIIKR